MPLPPKSSNSRIRQFGLNVHPYAFAYYRNSANRIAQYLSDELSLDEMLVNLQQDIDAAIAEAQK